MNHEKEESQPSMSEWKKTFPMDLVGLRPVSGKILRGEVFLFSGEQGVSDKCAGSNRPLLCMRHKIKGSSMQADCVRKIFVIKYEKDFCRSLWVLCCGEVR